LSAQNVNHHIGTKQEIKNKMTGFIKWAGGKKQLLEQFKPLFPKKIERYFEVFVGGGAVLFYIIKTYKPKYIFISDINEELINAYEIIKNDVENLIKELTKLKQLHSKEHYYEVRAENPKLLSPLTRASRFIYLNKTCFNGLYRVNSKGGFNVPMGSYKNPSICQEKDLKEISKLLKDVKIKVMSFEEITKLTKKNDFIYFDPPYYPLKKGQSFTIYTKGNFLEKEQKQLAEVFKKLDKKGCNVMLSNSDTKFIKDLYTDYNMTFVNANRMINCDGSKRGKIKEIVVRNYQDTNKV
jgi:DNA adenine methylase